MRWDFRVIRFKLNRPTRGEHEWYQMARVYYEGDTITAWSDGEALPGSDTARELQDELEMMQAAFVLPILNVEEMPK